ncbi:hypothetical protein LU293_09610 [Moraxella nasovis]|uniref:hypothetical protein n=1 Tax=Moraxella nasovis TaxID=2904121 RepID=UPI001F61D7B8|nr:hypothetical protein [Moraxella nasovis]UNU73303.1 hypothetical protein LU293_09610 [Moraxella nasovis]
MLQFMVSIPDELQGAFEHQAKAHDLSIQEYAEYVLLRDMEDFPFNKERILASINSGIVEAPKFNSNTEFVAWVRSR